MSELAPQEHESKNSLSSKEAHEHKEHLKERIESAAEKSSESGAAEREARHEVMETAPLAAEVTNTETEDTPQDDSPTTRDDKRHSFNTTMHHVRKELPKSERAFSKVIHQPVVEKTSEFVGKTVARPSGVLGATIAGFIGLLLVFGVAKRVGFALSGSELPLLLGVGLLVGLVSEWFYKSIRSLLSARR
ncbi:hypothetical protein KC973_00985 [Candidatus Saccharibacteria bacterium]|nr:hypothetical protein [Candidatus Saccharibacteria bacterium]